MKTHTPLSPGTIHKHLGPDSFVKRVEVFETVDSTNAYARELAAAGVREPVLIIAEEQTQGRGRFGRPWHSEKGKNLTFSLLVSPQVSNDRLGLLPLCVAEGVAKAIERQTGLHVVTKWPNDLLFDGRKLCGILLESAKPEWIVVGIGLNVNQTSFPVGLKATSLSLAGDKSLDRLGLLNAIISQLPWLSGSVTPAQLDELLAGWKSRCAVIGRPIRVEFADGQLNGVAKDVASDGALIVVTEGKERKVFAGDIVETHT